jgi:hypothetical protein
MNMKLSFNRHILSLSVIDSGIITPMMAVIHRFPEPGSYHATVLQGDVQVATFTLVVDRDAPLTPATVDLADLQCAAFVVNPQTHVLFQAPGAKEGYSVVVEGTDGKTRSIVFDNRKLENGDMLMAVLLRPGCYIASDQHGARCEISVAPFEKGAVRYLPSQKRGVIRSGNPLSIEYGKDGFRPKKVEARSAQGMYFTIKAPARIRIAFESAGEGSQAQEKKTAR